MDAISTDVGRSARAGSAVAAAIVLLAGCGLGGSATHGSVRSLHDVLPAALRSSGVLRIGSDLNYAPVEFKDADGRAVGLDPDIAEVIGKRLGLRVQFIDTVFDELIPGLNGNKFDLAMSAMSDNQQRREGTDNSGKLVNPGVDFIDYFIAGTSIVVPKGNPERIEGIDDLCGHTIAVQRGTTQAEIAERQTAACAKVHKRLAIRLFDNDGEALASVASADAVADMNDFPVAAYLAQKGGPTGAQFEIAGTQLQSAPYGIAVAKGNTALRDAVAKALNQAIQSGEYDQILARWALSNGAAQNAVVNGGH